MLAHPILIQRPIVIAPPGVRLCRPSEVVLDILPAPQRGAFAKEDGEPVVDARRAHRQAGAVTDRRLPQRVAAEGIGTALLLAAVVGSGIMGERLAGGSIGLALLANTLATAAALVALILAFGAVSGAHFNPAVTLSLASRGALPWRAVPGYLAAQSAGAVLGVWLAHVMFDLPVMGLPTRDQEPDGWSGRLAAPFRAMRLPTTRAWRRARAVQDAARRRGAPGPLCGLLDRACARRSTARQVGTEGCRLQSNRRMGVGSRCHGRAVVGVEQHLAPQKDAGKL
jgi:hypothetical protein